MKFAIPSLLLFSALVAVGTIWARQRQAASDLQSQLTTLRLENGGLLHAKSERQRLQQFQRELDQWNAVERPAPQLAPRSNDHASPLTSLTTGEWLPHTAWRNRGRATPAAALETMLWAAAGGDLATLRDSLLLDDDSRAQAGETFSQLPLSARSLVTSPDDLMAAFVVTSTPLGEARIVWQQQSHPDVATLCVLMKRTAPASDLQAPPSADPGEKTPASSPSKAEIKTAYLTLQRSDEHGWRLLPRPR